MQPAKLQFSQHELDLVTDAGWILTKNEILDKISRILGEVHLSQKDILAAAGNKLPEKATTTTPKISRGENYQGLPHLVLDYPRVFDRGNIFAIRSLFWWGRTISTTVHLSGQWQQFYEEKIINAYPYLAQNNFVVATGPKEWVHDATSADYSKIELLSIEDFEELVRSKSFLKIALYSPISKINEASGIWQQQFSSIAAVLGG